MDEYKGGEEGGWWTKRPAPHMAFNSEGLPGVMGDVWTRVYAGISLVFQWCLSIKVPLSSVRLIPVWKMPAGRCVSTTEASQPIKKPRKGLSGSSLLHCALIPLMCNTYSTEANCGFPVVISRLHQRIDKIGT